MSNEIQVVLNITVRSNLLEYVPRPTAFQMDIENAGGPTPGEITVPTTGIDVNLAQLTTPGLCRMMNLSNSYHVEYGIHDGSVFHPLGELPPATAAPGKPFLLYLSRNLGEEHVIAGTGTTGTVNTFHMKAYGGSAKVLVEVFER